MFNAIKATLSDDQGQGLAEYGLILGLVSVAAFAGLALLGTNIQTVMNSVATKI
jgi:pilus assembly protein Flp/PilA